MEHTFETYGVTKGTTNNLMDYADSKHLTCWQWDLLHNPRPVWSFLEGDESGMFAGGYALSPDYRIISVPTSTLTASGVEESNLKTGTLPGFVIYNEGNKTFYKWNGSEYVNDTNEKYNVTYIYNPNANINLTLFYNLHQGCGLKGYINTTYNQEIKAI